MTYDPHTLPPPKIPEAPLVLLSSNVRVSLKIASRPSDAAVVARPCRPRRPCRPPPTDASLNPALSPPLLVPSGLRSLRGRGIPHVRTSPPGRTCRNRSPPRHHPQRLGPSLRFRYRRRPHLLRPSSHRPRRNHRQAAPQHRRGHLLQRPSHRLPARPFRVRPGIHFPPVRLVLPPHPSLLQFRAAEPTLRPPGPRASLHPSSIAVLRRRQPRDL